MSGAAAIPDAWKEWLLHNRDRGCARQGLMDRALAQGFDALIRRRLLMKQAPDSNFDLGLDIDEVHIN